MEITLTMLRSASYNISAEKVLFNDVSGFGLLSLIQKLMYSISKQLIIIWTLAVVKYDSVQGNTKSNYNGNKTSSPKKKMWLFKNEIVPYQNETVPYQNEILPYQKKLRHTN